MIELVKYTEIHRAIVKKLEENTGVEALSVDEGITRPSFFISLDNIKARDFMREALDREITVRIYYFPSTIDNNKIELLNMQDKLSELFLHCYFDIRLCENYNRIDNIPVMENLEIERKG